jgi:NAD-dependent SIR2 family protein deacetylase
MRMWYFTCRKCGWRETYYTWPFHKCVRFPACTRCGGQTYRPSLEDTDLRRDEEHEDGTEDFEREERRA